MVFPKEIMQEKADELAGRAGRKVKLNAFRLPLEAAGTVCFAKNEATGSGVKCVIIIGQGKEEAETLMSGPTGLLGKPDETGDNTLRTYTWGKDPSQGFATMGTVNLEGQFYFNFILVPGGK